MALINCSFIKLTLYLFFFFINIQVSANVYYVSSSLGNNQNSGLTPMSPFKSISQLNSMIFDGYELGIVSGSSIDYMDEQLRSWDKWRKDCKMVHKYPVNGTQGLDMRDEYTADEWAWLIHDIETADHRMRLSLGGKYIRKPKEINGKPNEIKGEPKVQAHGLPWLGGS